MFPWHLPWDTAQLVMSLEEWPVCGVSLTVCLLADDVSVGFVARCVAVVRLRATCG